MSTNERKLLAGLIRNHIQGLNLLLAEAAKQGLNVYITDDNSTTGSLAALQSYSRHINEITQSSTLYVHVITHTIREDL
jgi:hypothetical protein